MRLLCAIVGTAVLTAACSEMPSPPASAPETEVAAMPEWEAAEAAPAAPAAAPAPAPARPRTPAPAPAPVAAAPVPPAPAPAPAVPEYRELVVPAGTVMPLRLVSAVASDTSQVEDLVRATLRGDLAVDGHVLPAGTEVLGHVLDAERSGRVRGRARVAFRFDTLRFGGEEYTLRTETVERIADATKGEDAAKIGVGAGAGAALGALLGGGSGATRGAAIGAAAGTGAVLATRGDEVRLEAGEPVETTLTAPLTLLVRVR